MCGICGELRWDGEKADQHIEGMLAKLERRGPHNYLSENSLGLGS